MSILHQIPCNYVYNANLGKLVFIVNMSMMNVNSYKCIVIKKLNQIIKKINSLKYLVIMKLALNSHKPGFQFYFYFVSYMI